MTDDLFIHRSADEKRRLAEIRHATKLHGGLVTIKLDDLLFLYSLVDDSRPAERVGQMALRARMERAARETE